MKMKPEQLEQELLEIIGTHPAYISSEKVDRVLARCDSTTIARVLALGDSTTIARVLALGDSTTIARVLALGDSTTIARVLALGDSTTIDRLKKIKQVKPDPKIYTKVLSEITAMEKRIAAAGINKKVCALDQKNWHHPKTECGTPHCAGGWIVAVTENGHELEKLFGMPGAPMVILRQSHPDWPLPNFGGDVPNEAALAFIRARAADEAKVN